MRHPSPLPPHALTGHGEDTPAKITFEFPEGGGDVAMASTVPLFCFPEAPGAPLIISKHPETFSFILTGGDGSKQIGYCQRFLSDATPDRPAQPQCYCIISYL